MTRLSWAVGETPRFLGVGQLVLPLAPTADPCSQGPTVQQEGKAAGTVPASVPFLAHPWCVLWARAFKPSSLDTLPVGNFEFGCD